MIRTSIIAVLAVGLIGVGYWGYKEHEDKSSLLIHAENNYQRSFHELSYHMDMLHDNIGTSLAMNSDGKLSPQFVDIWKLTSQANGNVSELPLSLLPFQKTKKFLADIGDFTYDTAVRNLDDDPLSDDELETLEKLYKQSGELKDELRSVQHQTLEDNLEWMDVEMALASEGDSDDTTLIDGFKTVENKADGFGEEYDGSSFGKSTDRQPAELEGEWKNKREIEQYTKELFSLNKDTNLHITKSGEGATIPMFSVSYEDGKDVYMDITQKGAHPVNIMVNRELKDQKLSLNDGLLKAEKYLKSFDYKDMKAIQSQQFDNVGVFTFAYTKDDIRYMPDQVKIKVALDDGEVVAFNGKEYLTNHQERETEEPSLTLDEAKDAINDELHVEESHLAVINNDVDKEVLTYELFGTKNDETYRVYINAENGDEEKVEKLSGKETNFDAEL